MPRPTKYRRVAFIPGVTYFKPAGVPLRILGEICLSMDEAEAIPLKDLEGLEQEQCAGRMNISRPTFQRVLASARRKLADAILSAKAIKIEGGNFEMASRRFRCLNGHEWDVPFEDIIDTPPRFCPTCNTKGVLPVQPAGPGWGAGRGRRYGGGRHWVAGYDDEDS